MFTSQNFTALSREALKMLAVGAILVALRSPSTFNDMAHAFGNYFCQANPVETHKKIDNPVSKPMLVPLPFGESSKKDLSSVTGNNAYSAVPAGLPSSENISEDSGKTDANVVQNQPSDHLRFALKLNQEQIARRFRAGIVIPSDIPSDSAKPTEKLQTGLTWNECEETMSQLTAMHKKGEWADGLAKSDDFLRALDSTPNAYPEYRILTAGLAFQMAAMARDTEKAKHFGQLAMQLSRKFENYHLEEIEGSFYQVAGCKFNFPYLLAAMKSLSNDFESLTPEKAVKRSEALVAACGSLPETSIFRLKADLFDARAKQALENDSFNALRRFGAVQSRANSVGNQVIVKECEPITTALFEQIQGLARTISKEIQAK